MAETMNSDDRRITCTPVAMAILGKKLFEPAIEPATSCSQVLYSNVMAEVCGVFRIALSITLTFSPTMFSYKRGQLQKSSA